MIYLDYAATSVRKPQVVIDAVVRALNHMGNAGRGSNDDSLDSSRSIFYARMAMNDLINGESASQIAFTSNVTESLNIAIKGLVKPGDHVITTVMEHNSVLRPLYQLEETGVELTILPTDELGRIMVEEIRDAIRENTRAIVMTHASNLTGNINPIKEVGELAEKAGVLLIVDAAQTMGAIPIDVQDLKVDVLCFTGHKSLLGPQGTGGLYVNPDVIIPPYKTGGTGVDTYNQAHPSTMPTALEAGTMNGHGIAGLKAAVDYLQEKGIETICQHERALAQSFYHGVKDIPGIKFYGDYTTEERSPIVTLNIREIDSSIIADQLSEEFGIAVRAGGHCAPLMHEALGSKEQGAVRFSFGHFTTEDEVNQAIAAIHELSK